MRYEDCVKVKLDLDLYNNQQLSSKMKLSPTINHDNTLELPRPWHDFHDLLLFLLDSFTFVGRHDIEWDLTKKKKFGELKKICPPPQKKKNNPQNHIIFYMFQDISRLFFQKNICVEFLKTRQFLCVNFYATIFLPPLKSVNSFLPPTFCPDPRS